MDERTLKALVAAGAVRNVSIIACGARFHVEARTPNGAITAETRQGKVKTWVTLDAAAGAVEIPEVGLCLGMALIGGLAGPLHGLLQILVDTALHQRHLIKVLVDLGEERRCAVRRVYH